MCFFIWTAFVVEDVVWYVRDVDVDVDVDVDWKYLEDANVRAGLFIRVEKGGGETMGNGDIGIVCFFSWLREGERKKERKGREREREREREGIVSYNPPCPSVDSRYFLCVKGSLFSQSKAIVCMCAFAVSVWTRAENARSSLHRFRRFSFPCCRKRSFARRCFFRFSSQHGEMVLPKTLQSKTQNRPSSTASNLQWRGRKAERWIRISP